MPLRSGHLIRKLERVGTTVGMIGVEDWVM